MSEPTQGLVVYRASRVEALLDPLLALLRAAPPAHALAPHELIAAHPGMRRWLGRELAVRQGPHGVAANLRIELPSAWLDRLARDVLGEEAVALRPYRREFLRWRIHDKLGAIDDAELSSYLQGEATTRERRRFQLADRLARLYSQYLVYRPDWLADWAKGRPGAVPGGFLAPLWKTLREDIGAAHRGERVAQLINALDDHERGPAEPLHVFGIAHLAPAELAVLRAVARRRMVALYVPDPCRAYWGGLRSERAALRECVERDPAGEQTESAFLEQGHPLLAAWGRLGQHFVLALDDIGAQVDTRHFEDEGETAPTTRLQGVQESIRRFDPALIGEHAADARADASLRVHACHTRLRELEVLRDALLDARSERPDLKPSGIVVMMPDIHAYLPLIPAVFGEAGRHEGPLPYHCADVAVARAHPLFEAFRRLLDLPQSRLTAPEVADLLATPPIAARLGLRGDDADVLVRWLESSRAAWALDGDFRARFDVPPIAEHTHAWAMERMLAGYVFGAGDEEFSAVTLPDGSAVAPLAGVHGPQAALLGALDRLLVELREACADGAARRRASDWTERLERRVDELFLVAPDDAEGREALSTLLQFIRGIRDEPGDGGLDPELDFSVVREVLLSRLDGVPERQRFLLGGVTFCGMVPQRAIPFDVVAVLGLDDGEFPRATRDGGLDPMARHPRLGDRDVRGDDRYLFLETVMSARWRLHLSYIGEGVRDGKPRNPSAPLAELMSALDAGTGIDPVAPPGESDDAKWKRLRPWWIRHPLQPFDARYFDGRDPALFSYSRAFAAMRERSADAASNRPFVESQARACAPEESAPIALSAVLAYYRDPARQLLEGALALRLDALADDRLRDSEPLEAKVDALDRVGTRLFLELAARGEHAAPDVAPDWARLTGMLSPGRIGEQAWEVERGKVDELFAAVDANGHDAHALFAHPLPESRPLAIERTIAGHAVRGELRDIFDTSAARWVLDVRPGKSEADMAFRERIGLFLRWALARLDTPSDHAVRVALVAAPHKGRREPDQWSRRFNAWDEGFVVADAATQARRLADLERRVGGLLDFFAISQRQPQWYFPKISWLALGDDADAASREWVGSDHHVGERDYAPGYARLLAGERDFSDAGDHAELARHAAHLRALIELDLAAEGGA